MNHPYHMQYPATMEDGSPMFFHSTEPFMQYHFYPQPFFQQQWISQFSYSTQPQPPACMRDAVEHPQVPSFPALEYNSQFVLPPLTFPPTIEHNEGIVRPSESSDSLDEQQTHIYTGINDFSDPSANSSADTHVDIPLTFSTQHHVKEEFVLPPDPTPPVLELNNNNDSRSLSSTPLVNFPSTLNINVTKIDSKWKKRTFFNKAQNKALESLFLIVQTLHKPERLELAKTIGLSEEQIRVWLQNRRFKRGKIEGVMNIKMGKKEYEDKAKLALYVACTEFEKMTASERASIRFNPY